MIDLLVYAFCFGLFAWFTNWCLGQPGGGNYVKGRIFSEFGRMIAVEYTRHELKRPNVLNPWKVLTCLVCFSFWVSLALSWIFCPQWVLLVPPVSCFVALYVSTLAR
jgi:hypothetical protein